MFSICRSCCEIFVACVIFSTLIIGLGFPPIELHVSWHVVLKIVMKCNLFSKACNGYPSLIKVFELASKIINKMIVDHKLNPEQYDSKYL